MSDAPPQIGAGGRVVIPQGAALTVQRVPLSRISVPDNRHRIDHAHVCELAHAMTDREVDAPPVLVVNGPGDQHWLIEGRHRYLAAIMAGRPDILAVVTNAIRIDQA